MHQASISTDSVQHFEHQLLISHQVNTMNMFREMSLSHLSKSTICLYFLTWFQFSFHNWMNRGVLLKSLSCAYGFDLVFVSLVISVLSMEIIRQGPDCACAMGLELTRSNMRL